MRAELEEIAAKWVTDPAHPMHGVLDLVASGKRGKVQLNIADGVVRSAYLISFDLTQFRPKGGNDE